MRFRLRELHRAGACVTGLFLLAHFANHFAALAGIEAHLRFMDALRVIYRQPLIEPVLLICVLAQVVSGSIIGWRRWRVARRGIALLQWLSGVIVGSFLVIHVAAVMIGRWGFGLDTNFYFAAAGLQQMPFRLFFIPYYALGIAALFAHLACAWHGYAKRRLSAVPRSVGTALILVSGLVGAGLIVAAFCGAWYPVVILPRYLATFGS